ncbi:hypothetical protein BpHYR1_020631 [Brachionus plicatilis]|uniref:Uncharacterized protein n=1 Tax=Brachionus plicatilis TaxID=10195 RepID=A0A3M7RSN0_BRAPC|nr:hypothetical protein BpHYR1_020631 [Brachionus plicatilis]
MRGNAVTIDFQLLFVTSGILLVLEYLNKLPVLSHKYHSSSCPISGRYVEAIILIYSQIYPFPSIVIETADSSSILRIRLEPDGEYLKLPWISTPNIGTIIKQNITVDEAYFGIAGRLCCAALTFSIWDSKPALQTLSGV